MIEWIRLEMGHVETIECGILVFAAHDKWVDCKMGISTEGQRIRATGCRHEEDGQNHAVAANIPVLSG